MVAVEIVRKAYKIDPIKIRVARAERGWTITKVAEKANLSRKTVSSVERSEYKTIQVSTLEKLAEALGKEIEDFLIK